MSLFHTEGREDRFFKTEISKDSKVGVSGFVERCLACEADGEQRESLVGPQVCRLSLV
jgi:hypothetical protein